MSQWFVRCGGQQQIGPITEEQVLQMVQTGQLRPSDLVWREGMPNWVAAGTLFTFPSQPPPVGPAAPVSMPPPYYGQPATPATGSDWLTTLLLCFFLGFIGAHRFYTGHTSIGVVQLLTLGGCGIWSFIDFIMILVGSYRDVNGYPLVRR